MCLRLTPVPAAGTSLASPKWLGTSSRPFWPTAPTSRGTSASNKAHLWFPGQLKWAESTSPMVPWSQNPSKTDGMRQKTFTKLHMKESATKGTSPWPARYTPNSTHHKLVCKWHMAVWHVFRFMWEGKKTTLSRVHVALRWPEFCLTSDRVDWLQECRTLC